MGTLLAVLGFVLCAYSQSLVGLWECVEREVYAPLSDGEDDGSVGDLLEIRPDGTYWMKYISNGVEERGTWEQASEAIILTLKETTDEDDDASISIPLRCPILQLTEETLEFKLDWGIFYIREKYKRIGDPADERPMIGGKTVKELKELVQEWVDELEKMVSELKALQLTLTSEKAWWDTKSFVGDCCAKYQSGLEEYEQGRGGEAQAEVLEQQYQALAAAMSSLESTAKSYLYECTVTAQGGGRVDVGYGEMQVENATKSFCWLYPKAFDSMELRQLAECFGTTYQGYGDFPRLELIPSEGFRVASVTQNGKSLSKWDDLYPEGEIIVVFEPDSKETAIAGGVSDALRPAAVYSVQGASLSHGQRGLNIVRYADGSVRKVLMR